MDTCSNCRVWPLWVPLYLSAGLSRRPASVEKGNTRCNERGGPIRRAFFLLARFSVRTSPIASLSSSHHRHHQQYHRRCCSARNFHHLGGRDEKGNVHSFDLERDFFGLWIWTTFLMRKRYFPNTKCWERSRGNEFWFNTPCCHRDFNNEINK